MDTFYLIICWLNKILQYSSFSKTTIDIKNKHRKFSFVLQKQNNNKKDLDIRDFGLVAKGNTTIYVGLEL